MERNNTEVNNAHKSLANTRYQQWLSVYRKDIVLLIQRFGTTPRRVIKSYVDLPKVSVSSTEEQHKRHLVSALHEIFKLDWSEWWFITFEEQHPNILPSEKIELLDQMEKLIRCKRYIDIIQTEKTIYWQEFVIGDKRNKHSESNYYITILNYFHEFWEEPLIWLTAEFVAEVQKKYNEWLKWLDNKHKK